MRFLSQPPPAHLNAVLQEFWLLEDDGAPSAGLPKPYVELVVSLEGRHWWKAEPAQSEHLYVEGWVTPLQHGPRYARAEGCRRLVGARLEPWMATALFGRLPSGDGRPPPHLADLIGEEAGALKELLLSQPDEAALFACFTDWLHAFIGRRPVPASFSVEAASERSARRKYVREVGLSSKQWRLLHRLDRVLRDPNLTTSDRPLAHLAQEHGFSDQSHFTRDLVRLTGATPSRLRRRASDGPPHLLRQD